MMRKGWIIILLFVVLLCGRQSFAQDSVRDTVLKYMAYPEFGGNNFCQKLTGTKCKFEMLDYTDGNIYFSVGVKDYYKGLFKKISLNPKFVKIGRTKEGKFSIQNEGSPIFLGSYSYYAPGRYFFRMPIDDFRVEKARRLKYRYGKYLYSVSPGELYGFLSNQELYGGYINVVAEKFPGVYVLFANHGAFVARKEASLSRLAKQIVRSAESSRDKAQKLLDFVINSIKYNESEALATRETLKRPNEVLITGNSDCSGKAILYASLLEQVDIGYLLLYMRNHISVGVEGNFNNYNGLSFLFGGKKYSLAETTTKKFKIGMSVPERNGIKLRLRDLTYCQKPGNDIYNIRTGKKLEYR